MRRKSCKTLSPFFLDGVRPWPPRAGWPSAPLCSSRMSKPYGFTPQDPEPCPIRWNLPAAFLRRLAQRTTLYSCGNPLDFPQTLQPDSSLSALSGGTSVQGHCLTA